jgi:hypothetical protein
MPADPLTQATVAARRAQVLTARAAGFTFDQIADTVAGVTGPKMAASDLKKALADTEALRVAGGETAAASVLELARLDQLARAVEGVMRRAAAETDDPRQADRVLRAADRLLLISERRSALLGLDSAGQPRPAAAEDELAKRRRSVRAKRGLA